MALLLFLPGPGLVFMKAIQGLQSPSLRQQLSPAGYHCWHAATHLMYILFRSTGRAWIQYMLSLNDNGTTIPLKLPNGPLPELNFENNLAIARNFQWKVNIDSGTGHIGAGRYNSTLERTQGREWQSSLFVEPTPRA